MKGNVQHRVALVDEWMQQLSDQDTVRGCPQPPDLCAVGVTEHAQLGAALDRGAERESAVDDPAARCPNPTARAGDARWWRGRDQLLDHAPGVEHPQGAVDADVEAEAMAMGRAVSMAEDAM